MAAKWTEDFGQKDKFTSMKFFSQGPEAEGSKQLVRKEDVNMEEGQDGKGQE